MVAILKMIWSWGWNTRMHLAIMKLGSAGRGCTIYPTVRIYTGRSVTLGDRVSINDFVHIWGGGGISIGDDTMIAAHCAIVSQTHDIDALKHGLKYRDTLIKSPIVIGKNVWLGSSVVILPGVTIGDGAVVGAGAIVTRDVPARTLVVGMPAREVRRLGD